MTPGRAARSLLAALVAALLATTLTAMPAAANDGYNLTGLRIDDGNLWHADDSFMVRWDPSPLTYGEVEFTVRDAEGRHVPGMEFFTSNDGQWGNLRVPDVPGVYLLEAWDWKGPYAYGPDAYGPPVTVPLLFDDARPAAVRAEVPTWVAAGSEVPVRISHPAGPLPLSGIAGYAAALDDYPEGAPCARAARCAAGEVDLPGGIDADRATLKAPSEGLSYVHVAAVSGSGMAGPATTVRIGVDGTPPSVHLEGVPSGWAAGPVRLTAVASDPLSGMAPSGAGGALTAIALDGAPAQSAPGPAIAKTVSGEGAHQVSFYARDAVGNAGDGSLPFSHPGTATVRIDETGPTVRFAPSDPTDPERIEAVIADALSGPDPDRGAIEVRRAGADGRFRPLPTSAARGRLVTRWSSDDYPHGPYEFRATGYDQAGNAAISTLGPGGAPFVLTDPVKRETRLAFGFGAAQLVIQRCTRADGSRRCHRTVVRPYGKRPAARTMPCCHGALVGGRLVDASGAPLAGQTVEVVETLARGARNAARRTALVTGADGRFATRLAPGPSREVSAAFPGTGRLTRAGGRAVRLRVRAAVHLRVSTARVRVGGAPVVFSGRIGHPEAHLPAGGLPVELEFRLPGTAWAQFRTVQTDAEGRFRYPYEFSDDDSAGVRFLFRAFVPASGNWPFAPSTSRPLAVTG